MQIIIQGVRGSGKTVLANFIAKTLQNAGYKVTGPKNVDAFNEANPALFAGMPVRDFFEKHLPVKGVPVKILVNDFEGQSISEILADQQKA